MNTASGGRMVAASGPAAVPSTRWRRPSARLIELRKRRARPSPVTVASTRASEPPKTIVSRSSRVRHERPASAV